MLNRSLKKKIGDKERDDWTIEDYRLALDALPTISSDLVRQLFAAKKGKDGKG
jgi:hypothetical protein